MQKPAKPRKRLETPTQQIARLTRELAEARGEAQRSRETSHRIFQSLPACVAVLRGRDLIYAYVNPFFQKFYPNRKLLGKSIRDAHPELAGQGHFERVEAVFTTGLPFHGTEVPAQWDRDGKGDIEGGFFNVSYQPTFGEDGKVHEVVISFFEVTESKLAREAAQVSELRFRKIYESGMFGMLFWGERGEITDANETFLNLVGYTREDLRGGKLNWRKMTPPNFAEADARAIAELRHSTHCPPYEKEYVRKDGIHVPVIIGCASLPGTVGVGGIAFVLDNTTHKQTALERELVLERERKSFQDLKEEQQKRQKLMVREKAAIEASSLKSEFLANMSHEIRTPMNGVIGVAGILADTRLTDEQRGYVSAIKSSGEALLSIINDILDFSKIEAGKIELEAVDFDIRSTVQDLEELLTISARKKALKLITSVASDVPATLRGDSGRLRQVVTNLLGNAIKFTPSGKVELRVTRETAGKARGKIRFEVIDSGIGIPVEAQKKLFASFSQADASTSRKYGGTGLGLAISKRFVEMMGGEIGFVSEDGRGSKFWFNVDLVPTAEYASDGNALPILAPATPKKYSGNPLQGRVLVAEDNQINQIVALKMLEKLGLRADAVANGLEVLKSLQDLPYDLILMDCQMPEMDGFETTIAIRKLEQTTGKRIPIIAMTANAMKGDEVKCLAAGMDDYVSKPVNIDAFALVLSKWLDASGVRSA